MGLGAAALLPSAGRRGPGAPSRRPVRVMELDGAIDQVAAVFVGRRIDAAEDAGAAAVVIRLDTPGGPGSSTRDIVADMRAADVPVTVWVGPSGARAGSAGAFIAAASDELGMAPGTNIGSATPIGSGGEDLDAKVRNDAEAFIGALADEPAATRSRTVRWSRCPEPDREQAVPGVADTVQPTLEDFVAGSTAARAGRADRDGRGAGRDGLAALVPAAACRV